MLNFNHLYYFYVIAREGSVSGAAKKLLIAQPSLSAQLKMFENQIGEPLFARVGRQLKITERGRVVYGYARQMFELSHEMLDYLGQTNQSKGVRIQIGVAEDVERPFSVGLISRLFQGRNLNEQPHVTLVCGKHSELVEKLRDFNLDVLISDRPVFFDDVTILKTTNLPVVLAASPSIKLPEIFEKQKNVASIVRSAAHGFVMPSARFRLRRETDDFLVKHKLSPRIVFESDLLASVVRALVDGVGMGFVPYPFIAEAVENKLVNVLGSSKSLWSHSVWLLAKKRKVLNPFIQELSTAFEVLEQSPYGTSPQIILEKIRN